MIFEHVAINVPDSKAMADWYVKNCGLRLVIELDEAPYTRFLTDQNGITCIEIYENHSVEIPDYNKQHHLTYHNAFAVEDQDQVRDQLLNAGASFVEEVNLPNGTRLIMLRDPWGIPLQLVKRTNPWYQKTDQ